MASSELDVLSCLPSLRLCVYENNIVYHFYNLIARSFRAVESRGDIGCFCAIEN